MMTNIRTMVAAAILAGAVAFGGYSDKVQASDDEFFEGNFQIRILGAGIIIDEDVGATTLNGGAVGNPGVDISRTVVPATTLTYFFNDNFAAELFCCIARVDVRGKGGLAPFGELATTSFFAPTVTLQYHLPLGNIKPYVGAGVNYLLFFNEDVGSGLAGAGYTNVDIDNAWGLALQVGIDVAANEHWSLNLDVKKIFSKTDVTWTGAAGGLGTTVRANDLDLNPWIISAGIGYRFNLGDLFGG